MPDFVIVETEYGKVRGVKKTSVLNTVYNAFNGIKYATPPVGELRFKDPVKPAKWDGIFDATEFKSGCFEVNTYVKKAIGSEDSLVLNVYTKHVQPSKLQPVMLYIHGGGFLTGSSSPDLYSPDYFLMADVVLVTFNYRMGAFGFMSLKKKELNVPGNAGMKDQLMVMNFVKNNIQNFGGDPNNVTLFGHSSAGCCVGWHCVSKRSKGLFQKAIIMSGSILSSWSLTPHRDWANRLARKLGYDGSEDEREILEFLQKADPIKITEFQKALIKPDEKIEIAFAPVIEHYTTDETFISENPIDSLKGAWSNDIDIMVGVTSDEGLFFLKDVNADETIMKNFKLENLVPPEIDSNLYKTEVFEFIENLKRIYYPTSNDPTEDKLAFSKILGDKSFVHCIHRTILGRQNSGGTGKTYFYRFAVDSPTHNFQRFRLLGPNARGVIHADEINYLFKNVNVSLAEKHSMEFKGTERFISLFTSFASTGNPNDNVINADMQGVRIEPVDTVKPPFKALEIGENVKFDILPESERLSIWDKLFIDTSTPLY